MSEDITTPEQVQEYIRNLNARAEAVLHPPAAPAQSAPTQDPPEHKAPASARRVEDMSIEELKAELAAYDEAVMFEPRVAEFGSEDQFVQALQQLDKRNEQKHADAKAAEAQVTADLIAREAARRKLGY